MTDLDDLASSPFRPRPTIGMVPVAIVFAIVLPLPFFIGGYFLPFATEVLIFAIFAMSLDILLGYTGLMSFGHAAFFGLSAYTVIILGANYNVNLWLGFIAGIVAATTGAVAIGFFCVRVKGIPFLMLTMAFSQLIYSSAVKWRDLTGGSDGIGGVSRPSLFSWSLYNSNVMYTVVLAFFLATFFALRRLVESPLGRSFIGIRENETRMRAMGCPTQRYKLLSFVISGAFAGLAGSLYALFNSFISPDAVHWSMSGDVLLMVTLGGVGSLVGPVIGAAAFLGLKYFISSTTQHWLLVIGTVFIICVLLFPRGIYGAVQSLGRRTK